MGPNWVAFKALFETYNPDIETILPETTNREAIKIGVKYGPEFVCFPFKATLGNFKNALDRGAEVLIMAIDCGPCRFGFYASVQERILRDMGYKDFKLIPLQQADLLTFEFVKTLKQIASHKTLVHYSNTVKAIIVFLKKAKLLQDIQTAEGLFRAYERNKGDTTRIVDDLLIKLDENKTAKELRGFKNVIKDAFYGLDVDSSRNPLKVAIAGEIHITLEPFINQDIRRRLGEMGIEIHQNISLYDWVVHKFHLNYHRKWLEHLARPHIKMDIGGDCIWVIGEYIDRANAGFDGFCHCYPFTCMPEVTTRTIITNKLKKVYDLPVIFFSFDEHSDAQGGFRTRLEAFVELMYSRRDKNLKTRVIEKDIIEGKPELFQVHGSPFYNECLQIIQEK